MVGRVGRVGDKLRCEVGGVRWQSMQALHTHLHNFAHASTPGSNSMLKRTLLQTITIVISMKSGTNN